MRTLAAACLGVGLLVASLAAAVAVRSQPAGVSRPPVQCSISRIGADVSRRRPAGYAPWAFVISCAQADGARTWYATEPVSMNGVCSYRYEPIAPARPPPPERLVAPGTVFDRAAVASAGSCPALMSGAFANLWRVGLATFKTISNLDYRSQFQSQNISSKDVQIERISFVKTTLWRDQYQIVFSTSRGDLYGASVYRWPFGNYSISSFGRMVR